MGIWPPANSWFLGSVWAHNPNGITIGSAVFAQVTADSLSLLYNGRRFPPKLPLSIRGSWPPSNIRFSEPIRAHIPNSILSGSDVFAQMTAESPYSLQFTMECPFPLKIVPSHGGIWTPSNTWFSAPVRVLNPSSMLIGSAIFAGLTSVANRLTDDAILLVTIDRIYICSMGDAV